MEIDTSLKIKVFEGVYEPAEDSYLLIKAIEAGARKKALDMGCGCGIIALHLAKNGCVVTAADINDGAVENTRQNAEMNRLEIKCIKSDLFSNIDDKFDLIAFNPPYLPTSGEDRAWDGGKEGMEVIRRFLKEAGNYLTKGGVIYIILSSLNDVKKLCREFPQYEFKKIAEEKFFFERIYAYKLLMKESPLSSF